MKWMRAEEVGEILQCVEEVGLFEVVINVFLVVYGCLWFKL